MRILGLVAGLGIILIVLLDAFETIIQPRRVTHRFRLARFFYRSNWLIWRTIAQRIPYRKTRDAMLGIFGPISLLGLFVTWVSGLIFGFALVQWGADTPVQTAVQGTSALAFHFTTYLYMSGTTFFTLGYGDVTPMGHFGRALAVIESGLGFGFLAIIISYLPVLAQAFSRREATISLLDARAGSPPSAAQVLIRLAKADSLPEVNSYLIEWEQWCAELLESNLSFPVLMFYRSQHDNQSWLAALTTMLDTCALLMAGIKGFNPYRAQLTFAMARHAAVDLTLILHAGQDRSLPDRLPPDQCLRLEYALREAGLELRDDQDVAAKLTELRAMYEPFLHALARRFLLTVPPIIPLPGELIDNWQRSPGMRRAPALGNLPLTQDEHFG